MPADPLVIPAGSDGGVLLHIAGGIEVLAGIGVVQTIHRLRLGVGGTVVRDGDASRHGDQREH